jgi:hypothetical protein
MKTSIKKPTMHLDYESHQCLGSMIPMGKRTLM